MTVKKISKMKKKLVFIPHVSFVVLTIAFILVGCESNVSPADENINQTNDLSMISKTPPVLGQNANATPTVITIFETKLPSPLGETKTPTPTPTVLPIPTPPDPVGVMVAPEIADMVARVRGSVVSIVASVTTMDIFGREQVSFSSGSGAVFDDLGHIVTNHHVIDGASSILVTLDDGRQMEAQIIGKDPLTDIALLKVDEADLPYLPFADPSTLRVGNWVVAIGNALALPGGPTVTLGIVSALDRSFQIDQDSTLYGLVQTDTVINPGNSGGPLLNLAGEVVGINTAVLRGNQVEGIGFAVGGDTALLVAEALMESGEVLWPWLGVFIQELDAQQSAELVLPVKHGILVANVVIDSPAWSGGIRPGDVMLSISGQDLSAVRDLTRVLRFEFRVGDVVESEVWRDDRVHTFMVELGRRPAS